MSPNMPRAARQLPLELPHRAGMTRGDFLVGDANRQAIELVDAWPAWPAPVVLLAGPVGSGKTHIASIWRQASAAAATSAGALRDADVEALVGTGAVVVEDLHAGSLDEPALFHLVNRAVERNTPLLLTSRVWASALPVRTPDLASRLRAARPVELAEPDDDLLQRMLVKLFADRQLDVEPAVIEYVALRMERSMAAANAIVEDIDREALAAAAPITRRLAALSLARVFDRQPDLFPG